MSEMNAGPAAPVTGGGAPPGEGAFTLRARYLGEAGELFALALGNLVLKVVTLGIYHFWGRTEIRKYLWSHVEWEGERLVYTGTGRELLFGYLRALGLVVLPIFAAFQGVQIAGLRWPVLSPLSALTGALTFPLFAYLAGVALFASWRYRLSRTVLRGIRFGLAGSSWRYGAFALGQVALAVITLGVYLPYMQCRTVSKIATGARFGTVPVTYTGRGSELFRIYVRTFGFGAAALLGLVLIVSGATAVLGGFGARAQGLSGSVWLSLLPLLTFVGVSLGMAALWFVYQARQLVYHIGHLHLGALHFRLEAHWAEYLWLALGNTLLVVFTLGVAAPLAVARTTRFVASRLTASGSLDYAAIAERAGSASSLGEGITDAFDMGSL
jgi:uncharacterized membrane protein YjgN (DUF898 family)